jgi:hypothetical protein
MAAWIRGASGRSDLARALTFERWRMAGKLDRSANSCAGVSAKIVADVLDAEAKR